MTDFSLKSKALLIRQLNEQYDAFFKESDIDFINLSTVATGPFNTKITAVATDSGDYRDSVTFEYNRVQLSRVIPEPIVFMSTAGITTTDDLVNRLNTLYGLALDMSDILSEPFNPTALTTTIGVFTLKTIATSLMYIGTLEVYFGQESTIREWIRSSYQLYQSDGKSFSISGKSLVNGKNFVVGKQGTFTPTTSDMGIVLGNDGTQSLSQSALDAGKTVARFRAGQVLELTGPSFETSYDSSNNCLPIVPKLPAVFDSLKGKFQYTGALNQGLMRFSTDFDLAEWFYPFGVTYYVDSVNGNDANDGSSQNPLKTMNAAIDKIPAATTVFIRGTTPYFIQRTITDRTITFIGESESSKPILTGNLNVTNWSLYSDSTTVYQYLTSAASVAGVFDYSVVDSNGSPKRLTLVDGPAAVVATPGSYYVSSTAILIQTSNSRKPDSDVAIVMSNTGLNVTGTAVVYLSNLEFRSTDIGVGAETVLLNARPALWLKGVDVKGTFSSACLNNYGAEVFAQNCKFTDGGTYGSYHGSDRQTIPLGVKGTFLEVGCTIENIYGNGSGNKRASLVTAGVTGIRFQSTYRNVDGWPIEEYGANTYVAHFESVVANNQSADAVKGAFYAAGKDTVGSNVYGRSVTMLFGCSSSNGSKMGMVSFGSGEFHLYNTPVGNVAQFSKPNPYKFIYTSSQIKDTITT